MAKAAKKTSGKNPALERRYGSIAEIKHEFFPNAAAEEEADVAADGERAYEDLMTEFFGPSQQHRLPA